jgi:glycosyltransferase involved in cell wall biosynthesis
MVVHAYYAKDARVRRYADALIEAGHEVDVLCLREAGETATEKRKGLRILRLPLTRVRRGQLAYVLEYLLSFTLFSLYLSVLQLRRRYHLVHVHNMPDVLVFTAWLPKLMGAKIMLDFHDPMPELYISKYKKKRTALLIRALTLLERWSASFAHVLITANNTFAKIFIARNLPAAKLHVVHNLADESIFQRKAGLPRKAPHSFVLLHIGTVSERYGLDAVIRALPDLRETIPGLKFRVVGKITSEGDEVSRLKQLARDLGVADLVEFPPPVPLEDVPQEMADADIGVHTPVPDGYMEYIFPLKVGEFAAMEVPLIASRMPVLEDYLGPEGAAYIDPGDVDALRDHVLRLYRDPAFRAKTVAGYAAFRSKYRWEAEKRRYLEVVAQATGRSD